MTYSSNLKTALLQRLAWCLYGVELFTRIMQGDERPAVIQEYNHVLKHVGLFWPALCDIAGEESFGKEWD